MSDTQVSASCDSPPNRIRPVVMGIIIFAGLTGLAAYAGSNWVSAQLHWKQQRDDATAWMTAQAKFWEDLAVDQNPRFDTPAPITLQFLGATGLRSVCVVVPDKADVAAKQKELVALFPEATDILVISPGPGYTGARAGLVRY